MADVRNLVQKRRRWWVQVAVPRPLRPAMGKSNLLLNLHTADVAEAIRRRPHALAALAAELGRAQGHAPPRLGLSLDTLAMQWRDSEVITDAADIVPGPNGEPVILTARDIGEEINAGLIVDEAERIEAKHGGRAAQRFFRVASGSGTPIDHHLEQCLKEAAVKPRTKLERRSAVRRFATWASDSCLEDVDRRLAGRYASEILASYHPGTANKHLDGLMAFWKWLTKRGHVNANPWEGQWFKSKGVAGVSAELQGERAFTDDELRKLLQGPAEARLKDAMAISALSGMRIEELCMLRVADCVDRMFDIKRAKSAAGIRKVPIHSALSALVARRTAGKAPTDYLIHELGDAPDPSSGRHRSMPLSKQFTRYRRDIGIDERVEGSRRSRVNFHSFRRWFATKADHAEIRESVIQCVMGHARQSVLFDRYAKQAALEHLRACVDAVKLPTGVRI